MAFGCVLRSSLQLSVPPCPRSGGLEALNAPSAIWVCAYICKAWCWGAPFRCSPLPWMNPYGFGPCPRQRRKLNLAKASFRVPWVGKRSPRLPGRLSLADQRRTYQVEWRMRCTCTREATSRSPTLVAGPRCAGAQKRPWPTPDAPAARRGSLTAGPNSSAEPAPIKLLLRFFVEVYLFWGLH